MSRPILATKLYIPPPPPIVVARPRLINLLNSGIGRKLTLISAGAGFGKTTLLSAWLKEVNKPVAWLSLDKQDNEPARFLTYLIAALQTISPDLGTTLLSALQAPQHPPIQTLLTILLNELSTVEDNIIVVLDDYHILAEPAIDEMLSFILDHQPPQMHLLITTREDPAIPLSRLRARGQLTEIRAADLRFTPAETAEFLNQVMGLALFKEEITTLENRTEGWIAGLQLAALALQTITAHQNRAAAADFIQSFAGSHHFVLDYLVEEVLQRQPESVRNFLLQTAVLDRLNDSLCAAVSDPIIDTDNQSNEGKGVLANLARDNLFVIPLDNQRRWYRYHHLFSDVLRAQITAEQPDKIPILHQRASAWYDQHDLPTEAIQHAFAAEDFEQAANLIAKAWQIMDNTFQSTAWLRLVKKLPTHLIQMRPILSIHYATALLDNGEIESSLARLTELERRYLDPNISADQVIVVDKEAFDALPTKIALLKAQIALAQHDFPRAIDDAKQVLQLIGEESSFDRAQITVILSMTHWANGALQLAHAAMADWIDRMAAIGNIEFVIASGFALADISIAQGNLDEAIKIYKHSLQLAATGDPQMETITSHHHLGLAMVYHERGDHESFQKHLEIAEMLGPKSTLIDWSYRWHLAQARLCESANNLAASLDHLNEAKRLYVRNPVPDIRPIEAVKARIYLKQGDLSKAQEWADMQSLSLNGDLSYLREFENITFVRLLIANLRNGVPEDATLHEAAQFLTRLLGLAEAGQRRGRLIEILLLQALVYQLRGTLAEAMNPLKRALSIAIQAGYHQIFIDEGPTLQTLLRYAETQRIAASFITKLLAAFEATHPKTISSSQSPLPLLAKPHFEPLSSREVDVLRLFNTELSGPEIARELTVALSTIRSHTKNIYSKLDVNNRRAAVRRALELDLI